jgi:hypothetical protein
MAVSSVGAIGTTGNSQNIQALLSPYLNGVVRTSDAAALAQADAASQTTSPAAAQSAIAANGNATTSATALPPFANPAITSIGIRIALGQALSSTSALTPDALLSSSTLDTPSSIANLETTSNLTTLSTFNTINDQNSVATLNSLTAFNSLSSLTDSTSLTQPALSQSVLDTTSPLGSIATPQLDTSNLTAVPPPATSPTESVLTGDSGTVVQSNAAVLFAATATPLAASAFAQAASPLITPAAIVSPVQSINAIV